MKNRNPRDATIITQRICGVCPTAHGMASVRCLDDAFGYTTTGNTRGYGLGIPTQGRILRNLIEGSDLVMSHILHFYHLAALDYIDINGSVISGQSPWAPQDSDAISQRISLSGANATILVEPLNIRRKAHEMAAYLDGKHPHQPSLIPGGVTNVVTTDLTAGFSTLLATIRSFIDTKYVPTVVAVAKANSGELLIGTAASGAGIGCKKYLAYGTYPEADSGAGNLFCTGGFLDTSSWAPSSIPGSVAAFNPANLREYVKYSYYDNSCTNLAPSAGDTVVKYPKTSDGAYSWLKAPRYVAGGTTHVCEVGPLARVLVNYLANTNTVWKDTTNLVLTGASYLGLSTNEIPYLRSVLGRHAARAIECKVVADKMATWLTALTTTTSAGQTYVHKDIPAGAPYTYGYGFTEAPRGALSHWIKISGRKIKGYQCVVPTTWNASPKDDGGQLGPIETALSGTYVGNPASSGDPASRLAIGRIIRSFDPCIACAVHITYPDKDKVVKFEIEPVISK
jgi:hydrogenase large subunit